jgi:bacteriocin-like protein
MTNDSKHTKPHTDVGNKKAQDVGNKKAQLTEEELKKVSGGTRSDPEEGGQAQARPR